MFLFYVFIGVVAGIISGLGIGGGSILIIFLSSFLGVIQTKAQGINLLYFLPTAIVALFVHFKNKVIDKKIALICAISGIFTAILGSFIATKINYMLLKQIFGAAILLLGIYEFIKEPLKNRFTKGKNS